MKITRIIWFLIMITAGIALGLYYTWIINPLKFIDATFYDLRQDYKADYVLMVAEIYNEEPILFQTILRLDRLLEESAEKAVENAISNAEKLGYPETDLDLLYQLNDALGGNIEETKEPEEMFIQYSVPEVTVESLENPSETVITTPDTPTDNDPFQEGGGNG